MKRSSSLTTCSLTVISNSCLFTLIIACVSENLRYLTIPGIRIASGIFKTIRNITIEKCQTKCSNNEVKYRNNISFQLQKLNCLDPAHN